MYTKQEVAAAYDAMLAQLLGDASWINDIEIYDENDCLDKVGTAQTRAEERTRLNAGRAILANARLVFSRSVCSGNPVPEIDADGETIIVSVGYTAMTEKFRRVGLKRVDDLISIVEAAAEFGVSQQAVSQAVDTGKIPAFVQPGACKRQRKRLISRADAIKLWK